MEFILDTADVTEIKKLNELLTVAGVTTNPTIITKSKKSFQDTVKEIIEVLDENQTFFFRHSGSNHCIITLLDSYRFNGN